VRYTIPRTVTVPSEVDPSIVFQAFLDKEHTNTPATPTNTAKTALESSTQRSPGSTAIERLLYGSPCSKRQKPIAPANVFEVKKVLQQSAMPTQDSAMLQVAICASEPIS